MATCMYIMWHVFSTWSLSLVKMHLFFECVVTKELWKTTTTLTEVPKQVASLRICQKTHRTPNIVHIVALWLSWKLRDGICFSRSSWIGMHVFLWKIGYTLVQWVILCSEGEKKLKCVNGALECVTCQAPLLMWLEPSREKLMVLYIR
jgi:hypothetical protein